MEKTDGLRIDQRTQVIEEVESVREVLCDKIPSELRERIPNWKGYPDNAKDPLVPAVDLLVPLPEWGNCYAVLPTGAVYSLWDAKTPAGEFRAKRCAVYLQRDHRVRKPQAVVSIRNPLTGRRTFASHARMVASAKSLAIRGLSLPAKFQVRNAVDTTASGCYADSIQLPPIGSRPDEEDRFLPTNPFA